MTGLIQNVLIPVGEGYETVDLQIEADRIGAIQPAPLQTSTDSYPDLVLPGFVNAHTHSVQAWQRGLIPQLPLELWLADVLDTTPTTLEHHYLGAISTAVDTLMSGGTCLIDHAYLVMGKEVETIAALARGYKEVGIRAVIAPLLQDLPFVLGLPGGCSLPQTAAPYSTAALLEILENIVRQCHEPQAGIYIGVGPTGFQRCSDDLIQGCVEVSERYNLCRHTHLLETRSQQLLAQERYGRSAVEHLQHLGFLDHRTTLAHGVWLTEQDMKILAKTGSTVVHNPVSNLRLGSGIAPILKCLAAGVNVAIGCDGAASNDGQDLLEAIKLSAILHNVTDFDYRNWLTPKRVVELAALGGSRGINLADQTGSLEVGKQADLVRYDLDDLSMLPQTDVLQLLVLGRPDRVVQDVWVGGKQVVAEGKVLTVDVDNLRQELRLRNQFVNKPTFTTIQSIESHYRSNLQRF